MMKKIIGFLVSAALIICALSTGVFAQTFADSVEGNNGNPSLRARANGTFKIMQIADTQDVADTSGDMMKFLTRAIEKEQPDLIVFSGDQLAGYDFKYGDVEGVKQAIANILKPVVDNSVPFAVVFGNHDEQALSKEEQMAIYMSYPNCYAVDEGESVSGVGTYNIPIFTSDGNDIFFNIYLFDSGSDDEELGGYDHVKKDQIEWYQSRALELAAAHGGQVPSLVFQHIPVPEIYLALNMSLDKSVGAIKGFGSFKRAWCTLNEDNLSKNNTSPNKYQEQICASTQSSGQFNAIKDFGDVVGMYFGHDHTNTFVVNYEGIDLGYCPGSSFYSYGDGYDRAVRIFELNESTSDEYTTRLVTYRSLFGTKVDDKFHFYLTEFMPKNINDGIKLGVSVLAIVAGLVLIIVLLVKRPIRKSWRKKVEYAKENGLPKPVIADEISKWFKNLGKSIAKPFVKLGKKIKNAVMSIVHHVKPPKPAKNIQHHKKKKK